MARLAVLAAIVATVVSGCALYSGPCRPVRETVAIGLTNPRGLARGPDGALYVAEAGTTEMGGKVTRIDRDGRSSALLTGLSHSVNAGVEDVGAAAVAFAGGEMFVALGEGSGRFAASVARVGAGGLELVSDLHRFEAEVNPDGKEILSNPYALANDAPRDRLVVVDAGANAILAVRRDGATSVVAAWPDGAVPTGMAIAVDGSLTVAMLGRYPHPYQSGRIDRVDASGRVATIVRGVSMPVAVAFGSAEDLYVLEFAAGMRSMPRVEFIPRSGRVVRLRGDDRKTVVDRMNYPTALVVEPDGALLVSVNGALGTIGSGVVERVTPCLPRRAVA